MPWLHPETTHTCAQGWETAALIRAQNMFCCQIVSSAKIAKITTQEMTAQSHPTAVDGNLLRGNLQIWNNERRTTSNDEEFVNLWSGSTTTAL